MTPFSVHLRSKWFRGAWKMASFLSPATVGGWAILPNPSVVAVLRAFTELLTSGVPQPVLFNHSSTRSSSSWVFDVHVFCNATGSWWSHWMNANLRNWFTLNHKQISSSTGSNLVRLHFYMFSQLKFHWLFKSWGILKTDIVFPELISQIFIAWMVVWSYWSGYKRFLL